MKRLLGCLAEGGRAVVGNFSPANPSRPSMEVCSDWHLRYRDADALLRLASAATGGTMPVAVDSETLGINLFLHVQRVNGTHDRGCRS